VDAVELGGLEELVMEEPKCDAAATDQQVVCAPLGNRLACRAMVLKAALIKGGEFSQTKDVLAITPVASQTSSSSLPAPDLVITCAVEPGGQEDQQSRSTSIAKQRTFEEPASAGSIYIETPDTLAHGLQSPAPGLSVDKAAVELGGLDESRRVQKSDVSRKEGVTLDISLLAETPSPSIPLTVIHTTKACTLVSAIVRTRCDSYLACIQRGEVAPCLAWAREGIGTVYTMI
jgi:hypothetical protein